MTPPSSTPCREPQSVGVPASPSGYSAEPEPSCTVSAVPVSIPNAVEKLRENADALHQWLGSFDEHVRQASDPLFGRGYGIEEKVNDLFRVTARLAASIGCGLRDAASAIEAAAAGETTQIGSTEGESAAPQEDAQTQSDEGMQ